MQFFVLKVKQTSLNQLNFNVLPCSGDQNSFGLMLCLNDSLFNCSMKIHKPSFRPYWISIPLWTKFAFLLMQRLKPVKKLLEEVQCNSRLFFTVKKGCNQKDAKVIKKAAQNGNVMNVQNQTPAI